MVTLSVNGKTHRLDVAPDTPLLYVLLDGAGCYGRNGHEDATCDAALISKLTGRPVRVQWSREDEHGWDPKGPPTLIDIAGGLDAQGNIIAWDSELWVPKADITEWPRTLTATLAGIRRRA